MHAEWVVGEETVNSLFRVGSYVGVFAFFSWLEFSAESRVRDMIPFHAPAAIYKDFTLFACLLIGPREQTLGIAMDETR